jgi:hypothetical protein
VKIDSLSAIVALMTSTSVVSAQELFLFGGRNHDQFLGCLNCSEFSSESICNRSGAGSKYSGESIFNQFGNFGSEFSMDSPWNKFSTSETVPVLVDRTGTFYGYFTINIFRSDAVDFSRDLARFFDLANGDLEVVQNLMCE